MFSELTIKNPVDRSEMTPEEIEADESIEMLRPNCPHCQRIIEGQKAARKAARDV